MSPPKTKRKAPGGWRASQGGIPVTGIDKPYFPQCWLQGLISNAAEALDIAMERGAHQ